MDLSKISIAPRLRTPWEAIDLGFAMARAWWKPLALCWAVPSFIVFFICSILLAKVPEYAYFIAWWLKPLWDRLPIALASKALFGEELDAKLVLRKSLKIFKTDFFAAITWRRFSPTRSFDIPLTILEGLGGSQRSKRISVLHQTAGSAAVALTLVGVLIEFILMLSLWGIAALLIPTEIEVDWLSVFNSDEALQIHLSNIVSFVCMVLIAPFYTMGGFALYICRRIELEGWDIEIRFRHLANKIQSENNKKESDKQNKSSPSNSNKILSLVFPVLAAISLSTLVVEKTWAQDDDDFVESQLVTDYYQNLDQSSRASSSKQSVVDVLSGEDFYTPEKITGWRWKEDGEVSEEAPAWFKTIARFFDWLGNKLRPFRDFIGAILGGFEIIFWLTLIAVVGFVLYRYRAALAALVGTKNTVEEIQEIPEVLFGLDIRKESLPKNVPAQTIALWEEGQHRDAIGLLYRASLSGLVNRYAFKFYDGYTEQEVVDVVKQGDNLPLCEYLEQLTKAWQLIAYAHRLPASALVSELCYRWPDFFAEVEADAK